MKTSNQNQKTVIIHKYYLVLCRRAFMTTIQNKFKPLEIIVKSNTIFANVLNTYFPTKCYQILPQKPQILLYNLFFREKKN